LSALYLGWTLGGYTFSYRTQAPFRPQAAAPFSVSLSLSERERRSARRPREYFNEMIILA